MKYVQVCHLCTCFKTSGGGKGGGSPPLFTFALLQPRRRRNPRGLHILRVFREDFVSPLLLSAQRNVYGRSSTKAACNYSQWLPFPLVLIRKCLWPRRGTKRRGACMEPLIQYDLMGCKCLTGLTPWEKMTTLCGFSDLMTVFRRGCGRFSRVPLALVAKRYAETGNQRHGEKNKGLNVL